MADGQPTRLIGLTGGLASGKSTVGKLLRGLGAEVIDADAIARWAVEPGRPAYEQIVAAFGPEVLTGGALGAPLDRAALAARVFSDEPARQLLNRITHPAIAQETARRILELSLRGVPVAIYEVPLLVENRLHHGMNGVIVVDVPEETQIERAMRRNNLTREQAAARLRAQASRSERLAVANWVIDNRGSEADTQKQVEVVWAELVAGVTPPPGARAPA
jgi:dephospho-CoA kinase